MGKIEAEDQVCCDLCHMIGGIKLKCEWVTILTEEPNCDRQVHPYCALKANLLIKESWSERRHAFECSECIR